MLRASALGRRLARIAGLHIQDLPTPGVDLGGQYRIQAKSWFDERVFHAIVAGVPLQVYEDALDVLDPHRSCSDPRHAMHPDWILAFYEQVANAEGAS